MIVLDTNVLSETMPPEPNTHVPAWLDAHAPASLFVTTVTEAEIRFDLARLPAGKRRDRLNAAANQMFDVHFRGRVLLCDQDAARDYAAIAERRWAIGRPIT